MMEDQGTPSVEPIDTKPTYMERVGVWYLKRLQNKAPLERVDEKTYILDAHEREEINHIVRRVIIKAAMVGATSSFVVGMVTWLCESILTTPENFLNQDNLLKWGVIIGVTVLMSIAEMVYLNRTLLASVFSLTRAAHLPLYIGNQEEGRLANSLVRAALELPNPRKNDLGIDPLLESSKVVIFIASILYKLKVTITNFIIKNLVTKVLSNSTSRILINFVSMPVCALWNGLVCWWIIREAKIRALGPSAATEMVEIISKEKEQLSENGKLALHRAVAACIVRTEDLHPNLDFFYRHLKTNIPLQETSVVGPTKLFLTELFKLKQSEQHLVLRTLVFAAIIDGKISKREHSLLRFAFHICNFEYRKNKIAAIKKRLVDGKLTYIQAVDL